MASTITLGGVPGVSGNSRVSRGTGNLGVYATNGVSFTARQFGLGSLDDLDIRPVAGYVLKVDYTNLKIKAYRSAAHTHVLHFQTSAAANAVTAAADSLRTAATAFSVAGVADATGEGGIVTAAQTALAEVTNA